MNEGIDSHTIVHYCLSLEKTYSKIMSVEARNAECHASFISHWLVLRHGEIHLMFLSLGSTSVRHRLTGSVL